MVDHLLRERLTAQLLSGPPATSAIDVVERLLAVQAQDPRGARLAIRARSTGLTRTDVDRALDDKSLVITTLNRGTLHLVRRDDYWWLHRLTTPQLATGSKRRLQQEGVSPSDAVRGITAITTALADGPMRRDDLRQRVATAGVPVEGQAFVHVVFAATLAGLIVRGPMLGADQGFVLVRDWLGKAPKFDRDNALAALARRYLAGHGPASDADLARWAGITLADARRGLSEITHELTERADGLAALRVAASPAELPPPRLLGAFEPCLLGWVSRTQITGRHQRLVTTNGRFRPFAMVRGKAAATWRLSRHRLELSALTTISQRHRAALAADADGVRAFLG